VARLWQLKYWGLIGALIGLAALLAVTLANSVTPARTVARAFYESLSWYPSGLEVEFWRTLEAANRLVLGDPLVDQAELDRRLDVLFSRFAVFQTGFVRDRLPEIEGGVDVIAKLDRALHDQEPRLRSLSRGDVATLAEIRDALAPIGPDLRLLTQHFQFFDSRYGADAVAQLKDDFFIGATLIAGIVLIGVILVAVLGIEVRVRRRLLKSVLASQEQARWAREREQAALVESGRRFRAIAMANPVALIVCARERATISYANQSAVTLFGLPEGGAHDTDLGAFFIDRAALQAVMGADERGTDQRETRLRRVGGGEFTASLSARALEYDGAPSVVIGILDQTEREAAAIEIERQREIIHHTEKLGALGSLLAGVAHELNNPLSVVVAQATLLEEETTDRNTAARGGKIRTAAERCARIVKTFLAMARQRPPSRAEVNMNDVIDGAVDLLGYGLRTADVEVQRDLDQSLPKIWADPDQINQVFANLIINAQQALGEWSGPRKLAIATRFDAGDGMVRITVADSGPGVPAPIRSRIFEPFFTTKPVGVGTGIGLSVSHSIVAAHGGTIEVGDAPGGGAAFSVRLPIGSQVQSVAGPAAGKAASLGRVTGRLLIVDDEPDVAQTLVDILANNGCEIDVVNSGKGALERLTTRDYSVMLCDLRMPAMDGRELYGRIRAMRPELADRLIFVTGDALNASLLDFLDSTGRPYVEKPFIPAEIRQLVTAMLQPAPAEASRSPAH
jgi:PAS domain S-box-containing protein